MDQTEISYLQRQALGQAARFEVLNREDVDNLSKVSYQRFCCEKSKVYTLTLNRNSASWMKELSISATPTPLFAPDAVISKPESASIFDHPA
jgi:hypothetical protein